MDFLLGLNLGTKNEKVLTLAAIALTNVVIAHDNSSYMDNQQTQSKMEWVIIQQ